MVIGVAQRAAHGETLCGDAYVIVRRDHATLVAVADGLGHGPEAARAASAFCTHAERTADAPLERILSSADEAIAGTRGVAASLLRIEPPDHFEFAGVGNVVLRVLARTPLHPLTVAGTLGRRNVRRIRCERFAAHAGDLLLLHTDGVAAGYALDRLRGEPPERVASRLLETHGRPHDDATCVVVSWGPDGPSSPQDARR